MIIRLEKGIKSLNLFKGRHWSVRDKDTKDWERLIWAECNGKPPKAQGKMKVKITSFRRKLLDQDNLIGGGSKGLIDSMVRLGILLGDSPDLVEVEYKQTKYNSVNGGKTELEITEVA